MEDIIIELGASAFVLSPTWVFLAVIILICFDHIYNESITSPDRMGASTACLPGLIQRSSHVDRWHCGMLVWVVVNCMYVYDPLLGELQEIIDQLVGHISLCTVGVSLELHIKG